MTGTGVDVLSTTVNSPTSLVARLRIAADAPLGFRDVIVSTGAENAALLNGFEVTPAVPPPSTGAGPPSPGKSAEHVLGQGPAQGDVPQGQEGRQGEEAQAAPARARE